MREFNGSCRVGEKTVRKCINNKQKLFVLPQNLTTKSRARKMIAQLNTKSP